MKFFRNLFSMSAMRIISAALTFSLVVAFSRIGGMTQLGQFSLLITLFLFFQLLPLMGLHLYLIRDISAKPEKLGHHLPNATLLALIVSVFLVFILGLGGAVIYADRPEIHTALWLVALSLIPTAPIAAIEAGLLGQQRMDLVAGRNIAENIVRTAIALGLLFHGYGLTAIFIVFLVGRVLTALSYMIVGDLPSVLAFREISAATLRDYLRRIPTFFGIALLGALSTRLDMLLMSKLSTPEQLGIYAAAFKLYEFGLMVPQIISVVVFPRLTAMYTHSTKAMSRLLSATMLYPILGAAPILIIVGINSDWIMNLFGKQAASAAPVLMLLLPALITTGSGQLLAITMLAMERSDLDLRTLVISTCATAALLIYVIPQWGAFGAASAMLAISVSTFALRYFLLRKLAPLSRVIKGFVKSLFPGLLMLTAICLAVPQMHSIAAMSIGLLLYLLGAKLLGFLSLTPIRELSELNKAIKGKV
ncbi:MAG: oligosaccharide flippase family protein [Gammaproteobacteria bacterium]